MKRALLIKQWDNEDLLSYVKRFKQQRDILKSHIGKDILLTFIKKQEAYASETSATKKKELEEGAFEAWMAYQLLANCDQSKYGSLLSDLTTQYSLGQDVFPKTITAAVDALSNHYFDQRYFDERKRKQQEQEKNRRRNADQGGDDGQQGASFAQKGGGKKIICHCCGAPDHISPNCAERETRPKSQWFVNQAVQMMQSQLDDVQEEEESDHENESDEESVQSNASFASQASARSAASSRSRRSGSTPNQ